MRGNKILVKAPRKNKNKKKTAAGKRGPFFFYFFFSFLLSFFSFSPLFPFVVSPLQSFEMHARAEFIHGVNSGFDERRYLFLSKRKRKNFVGLKARNRTWRVDWRESRWMSVRLLERTSFFSYRFRIFRGNIGSARILDRVSSDGIFPVEFFFLSTIIFIIFNVS